MHSLDDDNDMPELSEVSENSQSSFLSSSFLDDVAGDRDVANNDNCNIDDEASLVRPIPSTRTVRWSSQSPDSIRTSEMGSSKRCRHVSFGHVEIQHHAMILGDHPDTEEGPAVRL